MILIKNLVIISIWFIIPSVKAQIGFSDWETAYFQMNSTSAQKQFINKVEFPRNLPFPKISPQKYGFDNMHCWNIYLKKCFAAFFTESKSYSFNKTATLVYGLLNLGNYETISFHPQLKSNINDTVWVEEVYHSLIPVIKESWNILDQDTKRIYTEIIKYTETYIHTFNFKEELKYQKEAPLEKFISCSCKSSGKNEFRKAEAFIFRRICDSHAGKGNWTIPWTKKMLLILQTELDIK